MTERYEAGLEAVENGLELIFENLFALHPNDALVECTINLMAQRYRSAVTLMGSMINAEKSTFVTEDDEPTALSLDIQAVIELSKKHEEPITAEKS